MSDLISRQSAIEALGEEPEVWNDTDEEIATRNQWRADVDAIKAAPSAESEQSNASEFWRKRADYYSDMCMNLIGEMGKGVKIESVKISENGIEFIKEQPSAEPEIIRCKDCENWDTAWQNDYAPNYHYCPFVDGARRDDFYCADAERRTDG